METVRDIYAFIGQKIVDSISEDWLEAKVNLDSIGNNVKTYGYFVSLENERKSLSLKMGFQGAKKVLRLKEIIGENPKNKWNRAVFSLKPDGDFDMEFIWDQELQDEVESF